MEKGFYHHEIGYWQAISEPTDEIISSYPQGTIEVPLKPGDNFIWQDNAWIHTPRPEPTIEAIRGQMTPLTPRMFRDVLIDANIMLDDVTAAINQLADVKARAKALNAWEYPTQFIRTDPLIDKIGEFFNLTPEDIDNMWVGVLG